MQKPVLQFDEQVLLKAQGTDGAGLRIAFLDVDGVLTDGQLCYTAGGEEIKIFHTQDGFGLQLLRQAGVEPVVITGRDSAPLRTRLAGLGIRYAYYGVQNKLKVALHVLEALRIDWAHAAAMGDDWPDLSLLNHVAFAVAPSNAHVEAKSFADYVTKATGGYGALREFCDILLMAAGVYDKLYQRWLSPEA